MFSGYISNIEDQESVLITKIIPKLTYRQVTPIPLGNYQLGPEIFILTIVVLIQSISSFNGNVVICCLALYTAIIF